MVSDTLGEDAIIVATREEQGSKPICITAAVEQNNGYSELLSDDEMPNFEISA